MEITFLNVDLEIEGSESLQPIADYFGDDVFVLGCGKMGNHFQAAFEVAGSIADPDSMIGFFCTLVDSLGKNERRISESAFRKDFNVGYESGLEPRCYESNIRAKIIARVCEIGAALKITIYPPPNHEEAHT